VRQHDILGSSAGDAQGSSPGRPAVMSTAKLVQCCGGQAHAQRCEAVPEHALDLRGGSALLAARQRAEHGLGVAAALLCHLAGHDRPGHPMSRV
jgi:hypothetical protein